MAKGNTGGRGGIRAGINPVTGAGLGGVALGGAGGGGGAGAGVMGGGGGGNPISININGTFLNRTDKDNSLSWSDHTDAEMRILRAQMGQTGDEAGAVYPMSDPRSIYVATSKSYLINNLLRSDLRSLTDGFMGERNQAGYWLSHGVNKQTAIQMIRQIDNGMKPLGKDLKLTRYEGPLAAQQFLGPNADLSKIAKMDNNQLNNLFQGQTRTGKAYVSTSYKMDPNSSRDRQYLSKPFAIEYKVKAGTHAIVTNNRTEHEVLVGRGYTEKVVGARRVGNQIILSVEIDPTSRTGYYTV